jgi:hypothetical protein
MKISTETMLAADALVHHHGPATEEYATQKLWDSRQQGSTEDEAKWATMLEAIKRVREIHAKTKRGP